MEKIETKCSFHPGVRRPSCSLITRRNHCCVRVYSPTEGTITRLPSLFSLFYLDICFSPLKPRKFPHSLVILFGDGKISWFVWGGASILHIKWADLTLNFADLWSQSSSNSNQFWMMNRIRKRITINGSCYCFLSDVTNLESGYKIPITVPTAIERWMITQYTFR